MSPPLGFRRHRAKADAMIDQSPYAQLMRLRFEDDPHGEPNVILPWHDDVMGRPMYLHGGAIAGLLEFAAFATLTRATGMAVHQLKPITVTIDYLLGGKAVETRASGKIERLGANVANVEAFAWQTDRATPIATCRINFLLDR
jgi:acyl-coenzyme A thioesterase PaaI-like protein